MPVYDSETAFNTKTSLRGTHRVRVVSTDARTSLIATDLSEQCGSIAFSPIMMS
jgi:hypothetical protein